MVKKILLSIVVLILAIAGYYIFMFTRKGGGPDGPKQQPLTIKQHSVQFNNSVANVLAAYFEMHAAFVDADTSLAKIACRKMIQLADSINLDELKADTTGIFLADSISLEKRH